MVFIDPPYHKNLADKALSSLLKGNWLKKGAIIIVELAKTDDFLPKNVQFISSRIDGDSKLLILK
jgi:16S rRNA (guanine966-N2)-methyltransferase